MTTTRRVLVAATVLALGGCMMPPYKHPAGFSGSYFRHLHAFSPPPHVQAGHAIAPSIVTPAPPERVIVPLSGR